MISVSAFPKVFNIRLLKILSSLKETYDDVSNKTCTKDGFQTPNVVNEIPKEIRNEIVNLCKGYIKTLEGECGHIILDHIHFIDYDHGGYQSPHDHKKTEHYSCILYMNDSDGKTCFDTVNGVVSVTPEESKIVFFKSDILHWAEKSFKNKKVLVGRFIII
jgi:hypothetical protein